MFLSLIFINVIFAALILLYIKLTRGICRSSRHLVGKVAIVTGANTGIGFETAKNLAERGAKVILACDSEGSAHAAQELITSQTGNKDVHVMSLDLASLRSVRNFADEILKNESRLDILINNASTGAFAPPDKKTEDDLHYTMQVNHFGPFLLTNLLLPLLKSSDPSRIINVTSMAYTKGVIDFDNLNMEKEIALDIKKSNAHNNSKLCNILMAVGLSRQLQDSGVTINAVHPGMVYTEIINPDNNPFIKIGSFFIKLYSKNVWEGAQTCIHVAVSPELQGVSGCYFGDCLRRNTTAMAADTDLARKLWIESEKIVKLNKSD